MTDDERDKAIHELRTAQGVDRLLLVGLINAVENEREAMGGRSIIDLLDEHVGALRERYAAQGHRPEASALLSAAHALLADLRRARSSAPR